MLQHLWDPCHCCICNLEACNEVFIIIINQHEKLCCFILGPPLASIKKTIHIKAIKAIGKEACIIVTALWRKSDHHNFHTICKHLINERFLWAYFVYTISFNTKHVLRRHYEITKRYFTLWASHFSSCFNVHRKCPSWPITSKIIQFTAQQMPTSCAEWG